MSQSCELSVQQRNMFQQGYQQYSVQELNQLDWGLRFTPLVCSSLTAIGLYYQLPYLLLFVGLLGMWAFFFPAGHPMDYIYNNAIRHIFGAIKLPPNPLQRRMACLAAGVLNTIAAALFIFSLPVAAIAVGVTLLVLQAIVITTHFCTLSWIYEGAMRMFGLWIMPLEMDQARNLIDGGAILVDVRSQNEVAEDSVETAINLPLEHLDENLEKFRDQKCLLFCASGMRAFIATEKLLDQGIDNIYNLGDINRAKELIVQA